MLRAIVRKQSLPASTNLHVRFLGKDNRGFSLSKQSSLELTALCTSQLKGGKGDGKKPKAPKEEKKVPESAKGDAKKAPAANDKKAPSAPKKA